MKREEILRRRRDIAVKARAGAFGAMRTAHAALTLDILVAIRDGYATNLAHAREMAGLALKPIDFAEIYDTAERKELIAEICRKIDDGNRKATRELKKRAQNRKRRP